MYQLRSLSKKPPMPETRNIVIPRKIDTFIGSPSEIQFSAKCQLRSLSKKPPMPESWDRMIPSKIESPSEIQFSSNYQHQSLNKKPSMAKSRNRVIHSSIDTSIGPPSEIQFSAKYQLRSLSKKFPTALYRDSIDTSIPSPVSTGKIHFPESNRNLEKLVLRPEPEANLISSELRALAKMYEDDFGYVGLSWDLSPFRTNVSLFERGRLYDVYSAKRNERLKRKRRGILEENSIIEVEKKRNGKKCDPVRKSVPANFSVSRCETLRSSLSKENRAPIMSRKSGSVDVRRKSAARMSLRN